MKLIKGGSMNKGKSIVSTVFSSIDNVVSTVENIHGDIAGISCDKNGNGSHTEEKRKHVYGAIKSINSRIGDLVSDFFRQRTYPE
jgi:phage-related protein